MGTECTFIIQEFLTESLKMCEIRVMVTNRNNIHDKMESTINSTVNATFQSWLYPLPQYYNT